MQDLKLGGHALISCMAAALLASCAGSQPPIDAAGGLQRDAAPKSGNKTFHYTGYEQLFMVPRGVSSITVVARGAVGAIGYNEVGARGGRVYAILPVKPGETLAVFVGGNGHGMTGGYNGGGSGAANSYQCDGFGGGGASDVRRGGKTLADRILVAAGGGGHGAGFNEGGGAGEGGGTVGGSGGGGGSGDSGGGGVGGTQSSGGRGGYGGSGSDVKGGHGHGGKFGAGGSGGAGGVDVSGSGYGCGGGGGGGGYFGGGGGGGGGSDYISGSSGGGGAGGSSYAEPAAREFRTWGGWQKATGNGLVVISW
jgi:hypothetical protein